MSTGGRLVDLVQNRIDEFLDARSPILAAISDDTAPMESISRDFLRFGKRFRARFCYWGWQSVQGVDDPVDFFGDTSRRDLPAVIGAAAAPLVGLTGADSAVPMATVMAALSVFALATLLLTRRPVRS